MIRPVINIFIHSAKTIGSNDIILFPDLYRFLSLELSQRRSNPPLRSLL